MVKRQYPSSSGNAVYTTVIDKDTGASSCNCKGWIFKRGNQPRSCKHTKALLAEFGFQPIGYAEIPSKVASSVKVESASIPTWKGKPAVSPEAFVRAQAEVEKSLALVRGKRKIEVDDDEPLAQPPKAWPVAVSKTSPEPQDTQTKLSAADVAAILNGPLPPKVRPMLASAMKEDQALDDFVSPDWVLEEKFDGHRLTLVIENGKALGWSRPGVDRPAALRSLPEPLVADALNLPIGIYDGELFIPGGTSSDVVRIELADKLRLVLFDVIEVLGVAAVDKPFSQRRALLELCVKHAPKGGRVLIAEQQPVSLAAVQAIWDAKGEGAILKRLDSTYRSGWRTPSWVKVKKISAAELTVVGFEEGKNGPCSIAKLRSDDGRETSVKVLTQDLLRSIEKNPGAYVGKRLVISYMGTTASGKWRHPILDHFVEAA